MEPLFNPQLMVALGAYTIVISAILGTFKVLRVGRKNRQEETVQLMDSPEGCAIRQAECKEKLGEIEKHAHSIDISIAKLKVSMESEMKKLDPNGKLDRILARLSNE